MKESLSAFGSLVKDQRLRTVPIILLLNKVDVFASKIKEKAITDYFPYGPTDEDCETGCKYFARKFAVLDERPRGFLTIVATSAVDRKSFRKTLGTLESVITEVYEGEYNHTLRDAFGSDWFPSIHYEKSVEPSFPNIPQRKTSDAPSNLSSISPDDPDLPSTLPNSSQDDLDSPSKLPSSNQDDVDTPMNLSSSIKDTQDPPSDLSSSNQNVMGSSSASSPRNDVSDYRLINSSQPSASRAKSLLSLHGPRSAFSDEDDANSYYSFDDALSRSQEHRAKTREFLDNSEK